MNYNKNKVTDRPLTSRRSFILTAVAGLAATAFSAELDPFLHHSPSRIRAVAFDAFAIFDPRPVVALAGELFPGKGAELASQWRAKQFEYCWLRSLGSRYKNFWEITDDALVFAARKTGIALTADAKRKLMDQYLHLPVWPDVLPVLHNLGQSGIRLCFLSNMSPEMLDMNIKNSRLENYFDEVISTDLVRNYKPGTAAYQLGPDKLKLQKEEILFVAFAGWDACGSKWFGYPTYWLNRTGLPAEELDTGADGTGENMEALFNYIKRK